MVEVYTDNGHPIINGNTIAINEDCCCVPACPCDLSTWLDFVLSGGTCGGVVINYQILDYQDGDLSAPSGCDDSGETAWAGAYEAVNGRCRWDPDPLSTSLSIDGKRLARSATTVISFNIPTSQWRVRVSCFSGDMWRGSKLVGATPVGVYTRTLGFDLTATLTIVEA